MTKKIATFWIFSGMYSDSQLQKKILNLIVCVYLILIVGQSLYFTRFLHSRKNNNKKVSTSKCTVCGLMASAIKQPFNSMNFSGTDANRLFSPICHFQPFYQEKNTHTFPNIIPISSSSTFSSINIYLFYCLLSCPSLFFYSIKSKHYDQHRNSKK